MLGHDNLEEFADPVDYCNALSIVRQYGDWDEETLTAESPSIISVSRKRA